MLGYSRSPILLVGFKGFQAVLDIQTPRNCSAPFKNINPNSGMSPGATGWFEMLSIPQNRKADEISSFTTGENCPNLLNTTCSDHSLFTILDWFW